MLILHLVLLLIAVAGWTCCCWHVPSMQAGDDCDVCAPGSFDLNGTMCEKCPKGTLAGTPAAAQDWQQQQLAGCDAWTGMF